MAILADAACWCWRAALMEISHCCFSWCGRLRVRVSGLLRSVLEVMGRESRPRSYCIRISMSSARSFTRLGWSLCRTLFRWSHYCRTFLSSRQRRLVAQLVAEEVFFVGCSRLLVVVSMPVTGSRVLGSSKLGLLGPGLPGWALAVDPFVISMCRCPHSGLL